MKTFVDENNHILHGVWGLAIIVLFWMHTKSKSKCDDLEERVKTLENSYNSDAYKKAIETAQAAIDAANTTSDSGSSTNA